MGIRSQKWMSHCRVRSRTHARQRNYGPTQGGRDAGRTSTTIELFGRLRVILSARGLCAGAILCTRWFLSALPCPPVCPHYHPPPYRGTPSPTLPCSVYRLRTEVSSHKWRPNTSSSCTGKRTKWVASRVLSWPCTNSIPRCDCTNGDGYRD